MIISDVTKGTRIGTSYFSSVGTDTQTDTYIGTLDADEIDACIKSLKYVKDRIAQTPSGIYTELEYETKDGVSFGCCSKTNKKGVSVWQIYVKTKKHTSRSSEYFWD